MMFRSAFDLYRFELKNALGLRLPIGAKLGDEKAMWEGISKFLGNGGSDDMTVFDYAQLSQEQMNAAKE